MRALRHGCIILIIACLLIALPAAAAGKIVIDLPLLGPQQLPIDVPLMEDVSIGSLALHAPTESRHDGQEICDGDVIIGKGQVLSMKNYSLFMNGSHDGQRRIEVRAGGALLVENCTIAAPGGGPAFLFLVQSGGLLVMKNSSLRDCGFNGPGATSKGLWLASAGNLLDSNHLSNDYYGIIVDGPGCTIRNNTIESGYCGLQIGPAGAVVVNNTVRHNQKGIDASQSGLAVIEGNTITDNLLFGLLFGGDGPGMLSGNDVSANGEGLLLLNATTCLVEDTRLDGNGGHGLVIEGSRTVAVRNMTSSANAWGVYINGTNDSSVHEVRAAYNAFDGVFINNSHNVKLVDNVARDNGGYGYNVTGNNTQVTVDRTHNAASGNYKGDYNAPAAALTIAEVSLLSILIALVDKLIYLVDFQKVIVTNVFSGIVNPMREPLSRTLDRQSHRLLAAFRITRRGYRKAYVSEHMNVLFFHLINGKDIRGVVRPAAPARLSAHEIVLQQVRFFDLLFRDRVMLSRNLLYLAITTAAGIAVYTVQVWIGTYDLPYFLPLAIQFLVMFPIGLAVQGNVVGHVEKLDYDVRDDASVDMLRESILRQTAALEERHDRKKISDRKFDEKIRVLSGALRAVDYMDVRRHYLQFTPDGYRAAVSGFTALLEKAPDEPLFLSGLAEAHAMLGRSLGDGGHYEKALAAAQRAIQLDGGRFEARRALAMGLFFSGRAADARKELAEALRLHPGDAESCLLGAALAETAEEKKRLYGKAIALNKSLQAVDLEPLPLAATIKS